MTSVTSSTGIDARQVRTRERLRGAMLRLLQSRPFDQVTIREIATEAGIGYATFFRHVPSKEALLATIATGEIAALLGRAVPVLDAEDTQGSLEVLLAYVAEHRALWLVLLTGGAATLLKQEFVAQAQVLALKRGQDRGGLPNDLRVIFAVGAIVEMLAWWLRQSPAFPIPHMAAILDRLAIQPILP